MLPADFSPFESFPLSFPVGGGGGPGPAALASVSAARAPSSFYFPSAACVECAADCQSQAALPLRECISRSGRCRRAGCQLPAGAD